MKELTNLDIKMMSYCKKSQDKKIIILNLELIMKINYVKSVLVLSIGLINNEFLIGRLPFQLLHFDPMWTVISERIISISSSLLLIRIFSPTSFSRFGFGIARERRL